MERDNRYAYRAMESMTPNEDVINTRLESLEAETDQYQKWRVGFFGVCFLVLVGVGVCVTASVSRSGRENSACRDSVKMTNPTTFSTGVQAAMLTCDNALHKATVEHRAGGVMLTCTCR